MCIIHNALAHFLVFIYLFFTHLCGIMLSCYSLYQFVCLEYNVGTIRGAAHLSKRVINGFVFVH